MDLDDEADVPGTSSRGLPEGVRDGIVEPYEGMEFDSEEAAKAFYDDYARKAGFSMRVMTCRRSEVNGKVISRRLGCNREGYCVRGKLGSIRKTRASTRGGCKAMLFVRLLKSGKWVITKFLRDHNHPLGNTPQEVRQTLDEKDKMIQELTAELRTKKRLSAIYEEKLIGVLNAVEEHNAQFTKKVQAVLVNLKEFEN